MRLTRGARITGAVLCAVPALIAFGWIVRDLREAGGPVELWQHWAVYADFRTPLRPATSHTTALLLVGYVLAAVAALRSALAAPVLVATGLVTFALRLPATWTIGSWTDGVYADELRTRALIGTFVALAAGLALIVTAAAGRHPVEDGREPRPGRPALGAAVITFLLLGATAVVFAAWEIRQPFVLPDELYPAWFTGGAPLSIPLTEAPPGWATAVLVALCLWAAFAALARAVHARPLGLLAGAFVLASGVLGIARIVHYELYERFTDLDVENQLHLVTWLFSFFAGLAVLAALALAGAERTPEGGGPGGWAVPGPGSAPPGQGSPHPRATAPGPPQGGGFAPPPPPASPPPGW
ncbi:hypothetical protein [Streptomyces sp. NPDC088755]|uniref:hypothetical protein n=1 Tax=Streptomyces sp. NPDC088755 TaxID=3365888 RepID=UPI0037F6A8F4